MTIVDRIFEALGGPTALHKETGIPVQTIWDWRRNGNIPHWRRDAVIEASRKLEKTLDADMLAYLVSNEKARAA